MSPATDDFFVQAEEQEGYKNCFTFTEYEVGLDSVRGRPRKYGKADQGQGTRKQGIPRC